MANKYSRKNPYLFFSHPESVNVREILPRKLQHRADDALYIISLLLFKTTHETVNEFGYASLNSAILTQIMENRSKKAVIDCLIDHQIVECDGISKPNVKSFGYRLHKRLENDRAVVTKATDRRIIRALERFAQKRLEQEQATWLPVHYRLYEQQYRLGIDMDQANEILSQLEPAREKSKSVEKIVRKTRLTQSHLCETIHSSHHTFHVGRTRRVFNCVTSLSRQLRPAIRFKGKALESIDIRNSQPALLAKLAKDNRTQSSQGAGSQGAGSQGTGSQGTGSQGTGSQGTGSQGTGSQGTGSQGTGSQGTGSQGAGSQGAGSQGTRDNRTEQEQAGNLYDVHFPADLQRYCEETAAGTFYQNLLDRVQSDGREIQVETIKKKFLTDVLAKKKWSQNKAGHRIKYDYASLVENVFRLSFPTVGDFVLATNQETYDHSEAIWNKHANLIRLLQTAEAKLVIEDAALRALEHPTRPLVLTCHDAFFCGAGEAELMAEILQQAAREQGYQISLKHFPF